MPTTAGFHHITLVSGDAARASAFYGDLLGLRLVAQAEEASADSLYFGDERGSPGTLVTVLADASGQRGRWGIGGVHHLALGVRDEAAQLKWKRRLQDAGVPVSGPYDRGWFHSVYFADPDGQVVEIATRGPGYATDEPIERLGREIVMPQPHQMRGGRDEAAIAAAVHGEPVPTIADDMVLEGLHHITGFTDDIARANDFYERAFGLRLVKRSVNQDDPRTPHWFWASYDGRAVAPHSSFTLFEWKDSDYRARAGTGQSRHVAFRAADDEELRAWQDHLRTLEIETSEIVDRNFYRMLELHAPDGQPLAIATDGPGVGGNA